MTTNALRSAALMAVLITLFALLVQALGGSTGLVIAFAAAVALNVGSYWFSDKIVLRMYRGREVTRSEAPELVDMVDELRLQAGLPMPRVVLIPSDQPNAFATGRNPDHAVVAFTDGILRALPREELAGVAAHELAHIQHRDILTSSIAATGKRTPSARAYRSTASHSKRTPSPRRPAPAAAVASRIQIGSSGGARAARTQACTSLWGAAGAAIRSPSILPDAAAAHNGSVSQPRSTGAERS